MTRRATGHIYVTSADGARRGWLHPGDEVPSWASLDDRLVEGATEVPAPSGAAAVAAKPSDGGAAEPPRSGKGSGIEAWQRYADARGVGYDPDMSRDDIIAAVEAANATPSEE